MRSFLSITLFVLGLFGLFWFWLTPSVCTDSRRPQCRNNLKQLGIALHNYHEVHGSFPPAVTYDETGRPMHSWRVLILPFIEHSELYEQYNFDEPWNGPNNSKLAAKIPDVYRCPKFDAYLDRRKLDAGETDALTSYVAIVSPEAIFDGPRATKFDDIRDGTSFTIMIAGTRGHTVHWMQPEDVSPAEMLADLRISKAEGGSNHEGGLHIVLADGAVRFLPWETAAATFRALVTRAGGDEVGDDF